MTEFCHGSFSTDESAKDAQNLLLPELTTKFCQGSWSTDESIRGVADATNVFLPELTTEFCQGSWSTDESEEGRSGSQKEIPLCALEPCTKEWVFIERVTSDRKLEASKEGSK